MDPEFAALQTTGTGSALAPQETGGTGVPGDGLPPVSRELEMLNEELRVLNAEKLKLEAEVNNEEANMKLKQSEIKSMQNETETMHQMVKQLDAQRGEARKRLDDLGLQVTKAKKTVEEQRVRVKADEEEMIAKKKELNQIRSEESNLQSKLAFYKKETEQLSSAPIQLQISQVKALLVALEEYEIQLKEGTADLEAAMAGNEFHKLNTLLAQPITPPPEILVDDANPPALEADPFQGKGLQSLSHDLNEDPFAGEDPFSGEDPFAGQNFAASGFSSDPFAGDPFTPSAAASHTPASKAGDAFDPFGTLSIPPKTTGDPFGSADPFAARSESPAPELPPKKGAGGPPPTRPLPPKNGSKNAKSAASADAWLSSGPDPFAAPATNSASSNIQSSQTQNAFDPFGSSGGNFADFANFDKFS